jgi:hypothetical protein
MLPSEGIQGHTAMPIFLIFDSLSLSASFKLSMIVSCVNADGSAAACFKLHTSASSQSLNQSNLNASLLILCFPCRQEIDCTSKIIGDAENRKLTQLLRHPPSQFLNAKNLSVSPGSVHACQPVPESMHSSRGILVSMPKLAPNQLGSPLE